MALPESSTRPNHSHSPLIFVAILFLFSEWNLLAQGTGWTFDKNTNERSESSPFFIPLYLSSKLLGLVPFFKYSTSFSMHDANFIYTRHQNLLPGRFCDINTLTRLSARRVSRHLRSFFLCFIFVTYEYIYLPFLYIFLLFFFISLYYIFIFSHFLFCKINIIHPLFSFLALLSNITKREY